MIIISLKLLLTMCFGSLATDPNKITVSQSPTEIHISIGDCAEIACIWEKPVVRYRLSWYLVNEENITKTISSKLFYVSNVTHESKDVLVIKSANVNDTGFYYCEIIIEIPFCKKIRGNGTTVTVEGRGSAQLPAPAGRHQEDQMLEVAELCGRDESNSKAAEENSSCNSVEWAVSTLYEPCDYFYNESRGKDDKST
ncbi:uncharacterized protein LOC129205950 isoform X2 [Grus americana]|uniref:uncharacterized protein LOC129205950 isoform X2 n=1 Tax=Grus americana TaxID=9117 RepID=UPI00240831D8|nr:uncharacterized protein LOC129205950 isoform X2 [Grus americana]